MGLEPHDADKGHRFPGAQSRHRRRTGSNAPHRKDFDAVILGARLRRSRTVDLTLAGS